ncbi:U3 small nucleolar ribonucleoprotein complex, subunit Mpp10 [Cokeromyces recurvatus]|uniref:U3 small nucleolar ribonucleoprotein complex, subunit Mpp10 n=1 Tax=Cokeromyces recurvatus TaxID=90255 RepID=UPI00221E88A8|nr:U3 small nucleolar ribonucleoprotein complex, subunit Mpp10 [Cokeromyces recurvatus]KAI7897800.1 U3 small nucleolar ribonucleoprotein complex, subunit Mpp10 [Cokeromyces recurvatus]
MSNSIDQFISNVVDKPQVFFTSNQEVVNNALEMAKHFYDNVKKIEQVQFSPFTELLTEGFDNDQIWEEIAAQNEPFLDYAKDALKSFSTKKPSLKESQSFSDDESVSGQSMDLDENEEIQDDDENFEFDQQEETENESQDEEEEEEQEEQEEEDTDIEEEEEEKKPKKTSEVDDDFFNLEEFNKWTEEQEQLDMMSDREDDEFDFDKNLDESEDEEDEDEAVAAAEMTYNDFFGKRPKQSSKKRVQFEDNIKEDFDETNSDNEEEEEEEQSNEEDESMQEGSVRDLFAEEDDTEESNDNDKSAFQKQQERIQAQIEEFEEENIQDKHWTLRGEATANIRPVNSLLEEDLEFEHANKPVPVITQETTNTLEEMIKKRILDNMFDDVERKVDPTLQPFVPSRRIELSDEKAKQSLAEIYEDEYMHKQGNQEKKDARDEALEKEHEEITEMFKTLCYKLDALSNFHYTPKAPKPEMTIVSNTAAISMEEVIPVNVSEATLLAPEEVYDKKRSEVKATTEMTQEERKRLRAQKKKLKRKEKAMKEREMKVMQKYNPRIGQKKEKMNAVKELLTQKNVTVIGKDGQQKQFTKK